MKRFICAAGAVIFLFSAVFIAANLYQKENASRSESGRNITVNRISFMLREMIISEERDMDSAEINAKLREIFEDIAKEFDSPLLPEEIYFVKTDEIKASVISENGADTRIAAISDENGCVGFAVFRFKDSVTENAVIITDICILACALISLAMLTYVYFALIKPFNTLCEYPVKLSKGEFTEKLPEAKSRYFGKYIWGINMLSDRLASDKKRIDRLMKDKLTLVTTVAHGVKTPVSNIKLYADAIKTGLYRKDGIPDESDCEIAEKINKNTDDISSLVKEMIAAASDGIVDFEPVFGTFYAKEITDRVKEEYSNRLKVLRIPYSEALISNTIINSDREGIIRIISQLIENAVKYGDGTGISLTAEKQEDGFYFTLKSKGGLIPESEMPYIWGSFWRGSNAEGKEGSGIGLFEAKKIAAKLSGDICAKRIEKTNEMEFVLYIP